MESPVDKVYKNSYILKGKIHVCLSSILIEEARALFLFLCVLEKTKATKKQLKRSKAKK